MSPEVTKSMIESILILLDFIFDILFIFLKKTKDILVSQTNGYVLFSTHVAHVCYKFKHLKSKENYKHSTKLEQTAAASLPNNKYLSFFHKKITTD